MVWAARTLYIPEQNPVQDALEKIKKTTYFKLTLPNTGNQLKVVSSCCTSALLCMYASSLVLRLKKLMP